MSGQEISPTFSVCPKCGHRRQGHELAADPGLCPACGLVFAKWIRRDSFVPPSLKPQEDEPGPVESAGSRLMATLIYVPETIPALSWWSRLALLLLVAVWSWRLAAMDFRDGEMGSSFMHNILLPIHEAGHVLFIPLGEFMTIAGGSLFQWLLPLICAVAFLVQNRDPFGAAIGLWWSGTSLLDLAPYIYDAKNPQLILLGGHTGEDGPHDWIYLLGQFGKVDHSPAYGSVAHGLGVAVMVLALAWAGAILLLQRSRKAGQNNDKMRL